MKAIYFFASMVGLLAFQACSPVYIPNNSNVPLFTEKGQIQLGAYHGTNGTDLQAAVSVIDHLAVMGNFEISVHEDEDPDKHHKHRFGELGIGFYDTFGKMGRFEFYGGYGRGKSEAYDYYNFWNNNSGDQVRAEGKFERWFLQGNIGMGNKIFEGAISYRLAYINFYEFKEIDASNINVYSNPIEELMMEPAITIKVGGEKVKFVSQFGLSFPYDDYTRFDHQPLYFSLGILGKISAW